MYVPVRADIAPLELRRKRRIRIPQPRVVCLESRNLELQNRRTLSCMCSAMAAGGGFPSLNAPATQSYGPSAGVKRARPEKKKIKRGGIRLTTFGTSLQIRNPRELFPVRDDFIRSAWVQRARTKRAQELEELYPYFPSAETTATAVRTTIRAGDDIITSRAVVLTDPTTTHRARPVSPPAAVEPSNNSLLPEINTAPNAGRKMSSPYTKSHHMGVGTGPKNVAEFRRAFRRLEPEKMFRAPRAEGEPVWAYWGEENCCRGQGQQTSSSLPAGKRGITQQGFVLVPAKELAEVRALEGALRRERDLLKANCLLALNDGEISAHRPLEVTRMAVHDACGREMFDALRKYRAWTAQNNRNDKVTRSSSAAAHSNIRGRRVHEKSRTGNTDNFRGACRAATATTTAGLGKRIREAASKGRVKELHRTPAAWRTLRWLIMRRQDELRRQAEETEAMHREETEQLHTERYTEAWERQHDYDLYCVLAGQFWPLEAEAFRAVDRPGKKLYLELDTPARKIIRMWKTCWPFRKDRKLKGCVMFQALWRGRRVRRRWRPIIRLRLKHGRRACVRLPFVIWARTTRVHKWARRRFDEMQGRWTRSCFDAWADFAADRASEKLAKLARAGRTLKNVAAYRSFRSWQGYTRASHRARLLFARAVGGPSLEAWIRYTDTAREERRRMKAAVVIQRHARGLLARIRYRAKRSIIHGFNRLMASRRARKLLRSALAASHKRATEDLLQAGFDAEISVGLSREKRRTAKLQNKLDMADAAVRRGVTTRLKKGWLSATTRVVAGGVLGWGGELHREIKLIRQEWKALDDAAANGKQVDVEGRVDVYGGGGGGSIGRRWGFSTLRGMTWGGEGKGEQKNKKSETNEHAREAAEEGMRSTGAFLDEQKNDVLGWSTIVGDVVDGGNVYTAGGEARPANGLVSTAPIPTSSARNIRTAPVVRAVDHSAEKAEREARRRILCRERNLAREIVTHDFDAARPPPLKCCAPGCGRIFTQDDHYLAHWAATLRHDALDIPRPSSVVDSFDRKSVATSAPNFCDAVAGIQPTNPWLTAEQQQQQQQQQQPQQQQKQQTPGETGHPALGGEDVAAFHLAVLSSPDDDSGEAKLPTAVGVSDDTATAAGFDFVSAYIRRVWGHGQAYSTLMFWRAVSSWRRHPTTKPSYVREAVAIRRLYLDPGAPREASLPAETRRELLRVMHGLPDDVEIDALEEAAAKDTDGGETFDRDSTITRTTSSNFEATGFARGSSMSVKSSVSESTTARRSRVVVGSPIGRQPGTQDAGGSSNRRPGTERSRVDRKAGGRKTLVVDKRVTAAAGTAKLVATAAATIAAQGGGLRPTTFDEAQWQALVHLCRVVGPGFWASDLGRRFTLLHAKDLRRRRDAANEIVQLERRGRLANEAAEMKQQLRQARQLKEESAAELVLEATLEAVMEAVIRSAAAGAELLEIQELEITRHEEMFAEAATVEAVWIVEPPFLEDMLSQEITAFCAEQEERVLMSLEDDWKPPEDREVEDEKPSTGLAITFDLNAIPGGAEGAATASTTIQCAWRQMLSRWTARKLLAKAYVKRAAPGGGMYYENTVTYVSQWERPVLAYRLFPNSTW